MEQVSEWISASGKNVTEVARLSGVARSTIHRIQTGQTVPTLSVLGSIAYACGLSLILTTRELFDVNAMHAARAMLESGYVPPLECEKEVDKWIGRLSICGEGEAVGIVRAAGQASSPLNNPEALHLPYVFTATQLADAGLATRAQWALSGTCGIAEIPTPENILYTQHPELAHTLLTQTAHRVSNKVGNTYIVPITNGVMFDSWADGNLRFVAPIQILLDCFGLGREAQQLALEEAQTW